MRLWLSRHWSGDRAWLTWIAKTLFFAAGYASFMFAYMLWGSLVAKVRTRGAILDLIRWSGREQVLDVGCGKGLLLIGAARRLTTGSAVGIDLWIQQDQSSNRQTATPRNAAVENVADRIRVETGNMRQLAFADNSFDVVVSSWAVHNLEAESDRNAALSEMVRVLKPEGSVLVNDIANRNEYETQFKRLGMLDVRLVIASRWRDLLSGAVSFGSFRPATVTASKPGIASGD